MRKKIIRYFASLCMTIRIYMISLFIVLLLLQNPAGVYVTQSEAKGPRVDCRGKESCYHHPTNN